MPLFLLLISLAISQLNYHRLTFVVAIGINYLIMQFELLVFICILNIQAKDMEVMNSPTILRVVNKWDEDDHSVPVEVLIRLIDGFQELAWLLAARENDYDFKQRFKLPEDIKQQYVLCCDIPQEGSFRIPVVIKNFADPLLENGNEWIEKSIISLLIAVSCANYTDPAITGLSGAYLDRASKIIESIAPQKDDRWMLEVFSGHEKKVSLTSETRKNAQAMIKKKREILVETMSVIGELIAVQFEENKLTIRHPVSHTEITCVYLPEVECELLEKRRDYIQVTGQFTLDSNGIPKRLSEVSKILPVDLSPIQLNEVIWDGVYLKVKDKNGLTINPTLDEDSQQLFVVEDDSLALYAFAQTRDDLIDEVNEQIVMLWKEYVCDNNSALTESAKELKERLMELFRQEVMHA